MEKLILENVSKKIKDTYLVRDINLRVEKGETKIVLGASGSGKTTILNIISGIIRPDNGRVIIDGEDITDKKIEERNIGFVFQDLGLFYSMNVAENLAYGLRIRKMNISEINNKVKDIAQRLSIEEHLLKYPSQLSGGEKQLVALGRTLINEPKVILMDEPLSSLDTFLRNSMRWYIKDLRKNFDITIIYVTHDLEDAEILGDSVAVLEGGNIIQDGKKHDVISSPKCKKVAEILGYNIFKKEGKEMAIHPSSIKTGGDIDFKIIYEESGIGYNYLLSTKYGHIYMKSVERIMERDRLSFNNAVSLGKCE